jgi:hypothetical protein
MKIKTSELIGLALDWAVAVLEGHSVAILTVEEQRQRWMERIHLDEEHREREYWEQYILPSVKPRICVLSQDGYKSGPNHSEAPMPFSKGIPVFCYSTSWLQGGPIIERLMLQKGLVLRCWVEKGQCEASLDFPHKFSFGPTPLIAVMRCYVAGEMGDEIEIPEELI